MLQNRRIELILLKDVYKEGKEDTYILVKKDAKVKRFVYKDDITSVEEDLSGIGKPYKNRVKLYLRGEEAIVCEGNYKQFKEIIENNPTDYKPVGFVIGNNL